MGRSNCRSAVFRLEAVEAVVTSSLTTTGKAEQVAPNVLSIAARTASAFSRASCTQRPHASTGERCSSEPSTNRRTAAGAGHVAGPVRITHPFHPQRGQEIEMVTRRPHWGEDRVIYRAREGHLASLPARWTSLVPDDPVVVLSSGRTPFRVDDLIELVALVSRLRA